MPTTVEIKGLIEERISLLVEAGLYASKSEVVRDGVRRLLETQDFLVIALQLYKEGKTSLGKASEIAGLSVNDFVGECLRRRVPIKVGPDDISEVFDELSILKNQE